MADPQAEVASDGDWHTIDIYSPEGHFLRRMSREEYEEAAAFSEAFSAWLDRAHAKYADAVDQIELSRSV